MSTEVLEIIREALRVLFLLQIPLLVVGIVASGLVSIIGMMVSSAWYDCVVSYIIKVVCGVIVIGVLSASYMRALTDLMYLALQ
jgi:flagellar biosynthesis protein FliQ